MLLSTVRVSVATTLPPGPAVAVIVKMADLGVEDRGHSERQGHRLIRPLAPRCESVPDRPIGPHPRRDR
jgi:hypothetical protein